MVLSVKICGLTREEDIDVAIEGGASFLGFIFYPPSKRSLSPMRWAELASHLSFRARTVAVFVDADDEWLNEVYAAHPSDYLQLHGKETAGRVEEIAGTFPDARIVKSISVAEAGDVERASQYYDVADFILFDAKPPTTPGVIPGGNGLTFDWQLLAGRQFALPWLLAGGISASNLEAAVRLTGAPMVDVSSGVEDAPGVKNHDRLRELLALAQTLGTT